MRPLLFVNPGFELYGSDRVFLATIKAVKVNYPDQPIMVILPCDGVLASALSKLDNVSLRFEKLGTVRKYDLKRFNFRPMLKILVFFRLIKFLQQFDRVFINTVIVIDYILAARFCKSKVFIHVHEMPGRYSSLIFSSVLTFSKADLIFVSKAAKESFHLLGNNRQVVLWNCCDAMTCSVPRTNSEKLNILMIGRLHPRKGHLLLLKALTLMSPENRRNLQVRIVGGSYRDSKETRDKIIRFIAENKLDQIIELFPYSEYREVHYCWCDLVILPSILPESFGLVAIEAMSAEKLTMVADHGGLKEIIEDNQTGIKFQPGNSHDLAGKLTLILHDRNMLRKIAINGHEKYLECFTISKYKENILKILNEV